MITLTKEFKDRVVEAMIERRKLYEGTNGAFAKTLGLKADIFSKLHNSGERNGLLSPSKWIMLARDLGISVDSRKWNVARTDVYAMIEDDVLFCKTYSKAKIFVDDCGIGKTFTAKCLSRTIKNCFYVDASQAKTKQAFIRLLAKTVGGESKGRYMEVKETLKFYIKSLNRPIVIIDEAGDLEYEAFLELKELWNATENYCGWYMMGADGLRAKIERGITNKRVGFAEIFSRYSEKFSMIVPREKHDRNAFYKKLIKDVLEANGCTPDKVGLIINKCMDNKDNNDYFDKKSSFGRNEDIGGLRRAESFLILSQDMENEK